MKPELSSRNYFLLIFLCFSFVFLLCTFFNQVAQAQPHVSLTLFIVPENVACKPLGYTDYDSGKSSNCTPLTMADIPRLKKVAAVLQTDSVPPSTIKLDRDFFDNLDTYRTVDKSTPENRQSVVLLFEWDAPISAHVSLKRVINPKHADFPDMSWSDELTKATHWIHHERADAYLPGYKVEWTLTVGNNSWEFHTGRK